MGCELGLMFAIGVGGAGRAIAHRDDAEEEDDGALDVLGVGEVRGKHQSDLRRVQIKLPSFSRTSEMNWRRRRPSSVGPPRLRTYV